MWPMHSASVAMARPKANATLISRSRLKSFGSPTAAERPMKIKMIIPKNSARTALQNDHDLISDMATQITSSDNRQLSKEHLRATESGNSNFAPPVSHLKLWVTFTGIYQVCAFNKSGLIRSSWEMWASPSERDLQVSCSAHCFSSVTEGDATFLI